jgi:hypothetical protein
MRSKLLISTAALLAGIAMASAQTMQQGPAAAPDRGAQQGQDKGKAQQGAQGQDKGKAQQGAQSEDKGKAQQGTRGQKDQTTGQSQDKSAPQRSQRDRDQTTGQGAQGQGERPRAQQGQTGGDVTLTTEQRTRIRESVLASGPRVTNVNFSLSVGTVVPQTVRVVAVPTLLVEIYPQWRGFLYFIVGDQIIIVDQNHRIVAVITV